MLDLRRLRLLRELRDRGTIAAVADALSYTPSAVSQQLTQLEREAGVPLLERVGRGVRLTDAAHRLADHTDSVLMRLESAEAELAASSGEVRGRVVLAAYQTVARSLVVPILRPLHERHPQLRVELDEMESEDALPLLRGGEIDMALVEEYPRAPRAIEAAFERLEVAVDHLVLTLPRDHPAAAGEGPVRLRTLASEAWCTTQPETLFHEVFVQTCRSRGGFEPRIRHRANDVQLLTELVAGGHALALLPWLGQPQANPEVVVRPVAGGRLSRLIFAAARQGAAQRPAVEAVVAALRARAEELGLAAPEG